MARAQRIPVELVFETESCNVLKWKADAEAHLPLRRLVNAWAKEYLTDAGVHESMATLRDPRYDEALDLNLTPAQLWGSDVCGCRELWVEPSDELKTGTSAKVAAKRQEAAPAKAADVTPVKQPGNSTKRSAGASGLTDEAPSAPEKLLKTTSTAVPAKAPAKDPSSAKAPSAAAKGSKAAPAPKASPTKAAVAKSSSASPEPDAATPASSSTAAKRKPGTGKSPTGDDRIIFEDPNPKNPSSASGQRYAKYMKAKTVAEALALGAAPGDIKHDYAKGFIRRA